MSFTTALFIKLSKNAGKRSQKIDVGLRIYFIDSKKNLSLTIKLLA